MNEREPITLEEYRARRRAPHPFYKDPTPAERENFRDQPGNQLDHALWRLALARGALGRGHTLHSDNEGPHGETRALTIDAQFVRGLGKAIVSRIEDLRQAGEDGRQLADQIVADRKGHRGP